MAYILIWNAGYFTIEFSIKFIYHERKIITISGMDDWMKLLRFAVAFGTFFFVTGILYLIGHSFKFDLLMFHHHYTETPTGFHIETRSFLPFIIGMGASYIAEKLFVYQKVHLSRKN